jgi:hypothetical protein
MAATASSFSTKRRDIPRSRSADIAQGVFDIAANIPPNDVTLIATTVRILIRDDLHPQIVSLLLQTLIKDHGGPFSIAITAWSAKVYAQVVLTPDGYQVVAEFAAPARVWKLDWLGAPPLARSCASDLAGSEFVAAGGLPKRGCPSSFNPAFESVAQRGAGALLICAELA